MARPLVEDFFCGFPNGCPQRIYFWHDGFIEWTCLKYLICSHLWICICCNTTCVFIGILNLGAKFSWDKRNSFKIFQYRKMVLLNHIWSFAILFFPEFFQIFWWFFSGLLDKHKIEAWTAWTGQWRVQAVQASDGWCLMLKKVHKTWNCHHPPLIIQTNTIQPNQSNNKARKEVQEWEPKKERFPHNSAEKGIVKLTDFPKVSIFLTITRLTFFWSSLIQIM